MTGTANYELNTLPAAEPLRVRWLGTVPYGEALALQEGLFRHGREQHLLLLEHPHVFTYGPRTDLAANLRCEPAAVGAELVAVKRGGDVTYHGPGQLVGYPILSVANSLGATRAWLIAAVVFGAVHLQPVEFPGLFAFALLLGYVYRRTGRLGMCITTHMAFNACGLLLVSLLN